MVPCASPNTDYILFVIFLGQVTMLSALNLLSVPRILFFVFESTLIFSIDDKTEVQPQEDYSVVSLALRTSWIAFPNKNISSSYIITFILCSVDSKMTLKSLWKALVQDLSQNKGRKIGKSMRTIYDCSMHSHISSLQKRLFRNPLPLIRGNRNRYLSPLAISPCWSGFMEMLYGNLICWGEALKGNLHPSIINNISWSFVRIFQDVRKYFSSPARWTSEYFLSPNIPFITGLTYFLSEVGTRQEYSTLLD